MPHTIDFFRDEVRNGFYIPTAIKQAWAACLDVLAEIDRICEKHGIKYFADWGTILGAVRHGGFVPWDDDLDICMLRDDYTRFREVADKELPRQFVIHDYERKEDHWLFLSRVVNNSRMCFDNDYLNEHYNFPWLVGVDIFVKDYLYADDEAERQRDKEIMNILALADGIANDTINRQSVLKNIYEIEKLYSVNIPIEGNERDTAVALYRIVEQQMARVNPQETDRIGQIFPWVLKSGPAAGEKKELYERVIRLPFEDTTIPVPAAYNKVLSRRYGNYCEIRKVWGGHDYPFFEAQKADIEQLSGESLDRFKFDRSMLERPVPDKSNSLKAISKECLKELAALLDDAENVLLKSIEGGQVEDIKNLQAENEQNTSVYNAWNEPGDVLSQDLPEEFTQMIVDSQQLAADLGTLVEQVKGEERDCTKRVIDALQSYCDALWMDYQELEQGNKVSDSSDGKTHGMLKKSREAFENVLNRVGKDILNRKEILFLPLGAREWKSMQPYFDLYSKSHNSATETKEDISFRTDVEEINYDTNADIYVVLLPLMRKTFFGEVTLNDEEIQEAVHLKDYPEDICCSYMDWTFYDLSLHCPDVVYIQNPYDGTNPLLTVPPAFFASNIRKYADKIIYVPAFRTGEFGAEDVTDQYNLKHYVTAPGIIYSDEVIVWSDNIKEQYVKALTQFADEDTRNIWQKKIKVMDIQTDITDVESVKRKKILYCIGANELTEHEDILTKAVGRRLNIFREAKEMIDVTLALYPCDQTCWKKVNTELTDRLIGIFDKDDVTKWQNDMLTFASQDVEKVASSFDAYYGSPSPLVPAFVTKKKPVMLSDYDVL